MRARIVVEGANGPTTTEADAILAANGVLVVPDILANAGGVIVSYFEWVQANQAYWWSDAEVEARLADRMPAPGSRSSPTPTGCDLPLRTAATCLAVERVAQAHQLRASTRDRDHDRHRTVRTHVRRRRIPPPGATPSPRSPTQDAGDAPPRRRPLPHRAAARRWAADRARERGPRSCALPSS